MTEYVRIPRFKFAQKIRVWGIVSFPAVSELHLISQGQTIIGAYYMDSIIVLTCFNPLKRKLRVG